MKIIISITQQKKRAVLDGKGLFRFVLPCLTFLWLFTACTTSRAMQPFLTPSEIQPTRTLYSPSPTGTPLPDQPDTLHTSIDSWIGYGSSEFLDGLLYSGPRVIVAGLDRHSIDSLVIAADGTVWFTANEVGSYDGEKLHFYSDVDGLPDTARYDSRIDVASDGKIRLLATDGTLYQFDGSRWMLIDNTTSQGGNFANLCDFEITTQGAYWALDDDGYWFLNDGKWQLMKTSGCYSSMDSTPDGRLWIGAGGGVAYTQDDGETWIGLDIGSTWPESVHGERMNCDLAAAPDSSVWYYYDWRGLTHILPDGTWINFGNGIFPHTSYNSWEIFVDRNGTVWLTTMLASFPGTSEIMVFDGSEYKFVDNWHLNILSVAEAPDGSIWFGSWSSSLYRYQP